MPGIHPLVTAGLDTIALRIPRGFGAKLIATLGRRWLASNPRRGASAAPPRRRLPTLASASGLWWMMAERQSAWNRPSSRSGTAGAPAAPGGIAAEEIEALVGHQPERGAKGIKEAPGMMMSHCYAPKAESRLASTPFFPERRCWPSGRSAWRMSGGGTQPFACGGFAGKPFPSYRPGPQRRAAAVQ